MQTLSVIEIIRRSEQGVIHPFLCRASDGALYWVKGAAAGRRALCCEWIAGSLAKRLDLPIPAFRVLEVDPDLIELSAREDAGDLGAGMVFGSRDLGMVQELAEREVQRISPDLRVRILLFDWWVQNMGRTLGERGGNPNLLRTMPPDESVHIIDHNLAFDRSFAPGPFFAAHAFGKSREAAPGKTALAARDRMADTAAGVDEIWQEMPKAWLYLDSDMSMPVDIDAAQVRAVLNRIRTEFERDWLGGL